MDCLAALRDKGHRSGLTPASGSIMPGFWLEGRRSAICRLLVEPRPTGGIIGRFGALPIAETVCDRFDRTFVFVGAAPRRRDGTYSVEQLNDGEFIVEPGLVYRYERRRPAVAAGKSARGSRGRPSRAAGDEGRTAARDLGAALALWLAGILMIELILTAGHLIGT